jgi:hypothetical protein
LFIRGQNNICLRLVIVILRNWSASPAVSYRVDPARRFGESCLALQFKSIPLVVSIGLILAYARLYARQND